MKKVSKKMKLVIGCISIVVVGSCLVGYTNYSSSQQLKQETKALKLEQSAYSELKKSLKSLRNEQGYFVSDVTKDSISKIVKEVNSLTVNDHLKYNDLKNESANLKKEINSLKEDAKEMQSDYKVQESVNTLFQVIKQQSRDVNKSVENEIVAIKEDNVNTSLSISDNVTIDSMEIFKDLNYQKAEKISEWQKSINKLIDEATNQANQIKTATEKVNSLFDKENVKSDVSTDSYNQAKIETDKIKNEKAKKTLTDKLVKVKTKLDEQEKKKQEEQKQQEKAKQEAQQSEQQAQQQSTGNTANNQQQAQSATPNYSEQPSNNTSNGSTGGNSINGSSSTDNNSSGGSSTGGNQSWSGNNPNNGGTTSGGIVDNINDIPGVETGNTPW